MNEGEKKHIMTNLSELVDNTAWRVSCKTVPIEKGVFGNEDLAELECIPNERKRIYKFYEIFMKKENSYQHLIATLEAGCQSGAVVILNKFDANLPVGGTSSRKVPIGVRFDVQQPVRLFTGRLKELAELHEKLQESKSKATVISQMASIVGLGGIGKTELARMYIQKYGEYYDNNVIWISAETEETLRESFQRLAIDYLKISLSSVDGKEKYMKTVIEEVYTLFNGKQCLFVFDNAETNMVIQNFLPLQVVDSPYVLITSRDKDWSFDVEMLELHEMDELEAIALVMNGLQIQNEGHADIVAELVKTLQCYPLALSQAISYIKQKQKLGNYAIIQYLNEYKSHSVKLLNYDAHSGPLKTYTKTTFTTWKLTTECIFANEECGNEAIGILNMMSYFEPDKIPTKLIIEQTEKSSVKSATKQQSGILSQLQKFFSFLNIGANVTIDSAISSLTERNEKALQLLFKHSMINIQTTEETISIHRLVQEVTRIELRKQKLEEATLENALRLLSENIHLKTISHFCSVYKYCDAYKKLVVDFKYVPSRVMELADDSKKSSCYSEVGVGYELKETLQKHVSSEDEDVARLEFWIGNANYRVGNVEIAAKCFKQILPTYIKNKGDMFSETEILNIQCFLAVCLKELGNKSESLKELLQIYESAKTLHGVNDWWTTQVLVDIAECLQILGHFTNPFSETTENIQVSIQEFILPDPQATISLLKAAYENNRHLISTDFKHARNLFRIAIFFLDMGDNDTTSLIATDGYELGRESNDIMVQIESVKCLNVLGVLKKNARKFEEALEIFREAHAFASKTLGDNHPDTLLYKANMLEMLGSVGGGETALSGLREVLETFVTNYPNHPCRFWTELSIGIILFNMKRHDESLVLFVDLRQRLHERFGHIHRLMSQVNCWIRKLQTVEPEIILNINL
ncbi:unnamed protein product [Orchesella dallaii]|uniref:NB-ARC domain-containing protein n=1 Tax=Orchesella dallaii TaxID=48710 RepID=A0ABP1PIJ2_9HEXA